MDKNKIKKELINRFVNESTPGIDVTKAVLSKSKAFNDAGIKDIEKKLKDADKGQKKSMSDTKDMPQNKFNYNSDSEIEYHREMEIMNGQEMIQYDRDPNKTFKERAVKAIEGDSTMGNSPDYANVVPEQLGFTGPTFGKKLVQAIRASTKKRQDAVKGIISFGDDIETVPKNYAPMASFSALNENLSEKMTSSIQISINSVGTRKTAIKLVNVFLKKATQMSSDEFSDSMTYSNGLDEIEESLKNGQYSVAIETAKDTATQMLEDEGFPMGDVYENIHNTPQMGGVTTSKGTAGYINNTSKMDKEYSDSIRKQPKKDNPYGSESEYEFYEKEKHENPNPEKDIKESLIDDIKENNNKLQIKEGMKRLKFKQEFKGVGNALKLIPESYRIDNKVFEMTDGVESYRMRWEGTLNEGKAIVLTASDKTLVNEDMLKMKHLMGYKSRDTLGTVKGKARVDENAIFSDIWKKSIVLVEGEDIDSQKAPEKKTDEKVAQASEAKKHVKGSENTDKGTKAPAPKTGSADSLEKVKKQAPEAKKHVEGSVETKIGMGLGDQSEGEGEWDQMDVPQAAAHGNPSKTTYAPKPATGDWDKAKPAHAADAKKHIHMGEGLQLGNQFFTKLNENFDELMEEMEKDEEVPENPEDYREQPGYIHEEEIEGDELNIEEEEKDEEDVIKEYSNGGLPYDTNYNGGEDDDDDDDDNLDDHDEEL